MIQAKYLNVFSMQTIWRPVLAVVFACLVVTQGLAGSNRGSVTNLPVPRFVSLEADEGNVRRGPSLSHRIDWIFTTRGTPLIVTGEFGHWRRVRDRDGAGGWVHYALLSSRRTVIVEYEPAEPENEETWLPLLMKPDPRAPVNARIQNGVIARLGECNIDWCRITAEKNRGWVPREVLWGLTPGEVRE